MIQTDTIDHDALDSFVEGFGQREWTDRLTELGLAAAKPTRLGRALQQRHIIELTIERWRKPGRNRSPSPGECCIGRLAADASRLFDALPGPARDKLRSCLRQAAEADNTLISAFHLLRTAALQRSRGFDVEFAGSAGRGEF